MKSLLAKLISRHLDRNPLDFRHGILNLASGGIRNNWQTVGFPHEANLICVFLKVHQREDYVALLGSVGSRIRKCYRDSLRGCGSKVDLVKRGFGGGIG